MIERSEDAKRLGLPLRSKFFPSLPGIGDLVASSSKLEHEENKPSVSGLENGEDATRDYPVKLEMKEESYDEEAAMNSAKPSPLESKEVTGGKKDPGTSEAAPFWLPAFLRSNTEETASSPISDTLPVSGTDSKVKCAADEDETEAPKMSKNAMKREAKRARWEATKLDRRQAEKDRRRDKRAADKAEFDSGTMTPEEKEAYEQRRQHRQQKNKARLKGGLAKEEDAWKGGIIIDLGFDELMLEGVSLIVSTVMCRVVTGNVSDPLLLRKSPP